MSSDGLLGEISVNDECDAVSLEKGSNRQTVGQVVDLIGLGKFSLLLFLICGLGFCGDAFELLVLSFVLPVFVKEWKLSLIEQAFVTCIGFAGWLVGSLFWGVVADFLGRRKTYVMVLVSLVTVGLLQLAIVNVGLLLLLRFLMGASVGGVFTGYALLAEFLPTRWRIVVLSVFQAWFAIGSLFGALLAVLVLDKGWRVLVALVKHIIRVLFISDKQHRGCFRLLLLFC
jgi:MFS family permease